LFLSVYTDFRLFFFRSYFINPKKAGRPMEQGSICSLGRPNSKIFMSQKISPMIYPEKSWLFLKHRTEAFCKKINRKMSNLLVKQGRQIVKIWPNSMVFTLNMTSNQKNVREKKVYISAKDAITCNRKKIWNHSQNNIRPEKGLVCGAP